MLVLPCRFTARTPVLRTMRYCGRWMTWSGRARSGMPGRVTSKDGRSRRSWTVDRVWDSIRSSLYRYKLLFQFLGGHKSVLWDYWYPCFELLVTSALDFKATVDPSLVCLVACVQWLSQIHLWCDTCWPLDNQCFRFPEKCLEIKSAKFAFTLNIWEVQITFSLTSAEFFPHNYLKFPLTRPSSIP